MTGAVKNQNRNSSLTTPMSSQNSHRSDEIKITFKHSPDERSTISSKKVKLPLELLKVRFDKNKISILAQQTLKEKTIDEKIAKILDKCYKRAINRHKLGQM